MTTYRSDTDQPRASVHEEPDDLFDGLEVESGSDERVEYLEPLSGQERRLIEAFRLLQTDEQQNYLRLIVRRADGDALDNLALWGELGRLRPIAETRIYDARHCRAFSLVADGPRVRLVGGY